MTQDEKNQAAKELSAELEEVTWRRGHEMTNAMDDIFHERNLFASFLEDIEECEFVAGLDGYDFKADDIVSRALLDYGVPSAAVFDFFLGRATDQAFEWITSPEIRKHEHRRKTQETDAQRALEILGLARMLIDNVTPKQLNQLDAHLMATVFDKDRSSASSIVRLATTFVSYIFETASDEHNDVQNTSLRGRAWVRRMWEVQANLIGVAREELSPEWGEALLKELVALCVLHVGEDLLPQDRAGAAQESAEEAAHAAE